MKKYILAVTWYGSKTDEAGEDTGNSEVQTFIFEFDSHTNRESALDDLIEEGQILSFARATL